MKERTLQKTFPRIIIRFDDDAVTWASVGWGQDEDLMREAKAAINKGENPTEVLENLGAAGFITITEK